jgi:hypothetical protein
VPSPRESRNLVPLEALAVLAIAIAPWPEQLPVALPLLVAGSASRWARGRSWADVVRGRADRAAAGALAGALALAAAVLAGAPVIEALGQRGIEWSIHPIVRGNAAVLAMVAVYVAATTVATELALRGWIVERVLELSPGPPVLPVLVGAIAEALITPGDVAARLGGACFGGGLGWMYAAGGRSVLAPICARLAFELGAVLLEALRLIG